MWQMRLVVVLAAVMAGGCALRAGSSGSRDDWSRVLALTPATELVVHHVNPRDGARRETLVARGSLLAAGPSEIAVRTTAGDLQIDRAAVSRIAVVEQDRKSTRNGTRIGSAIGVVYGLIAGTIVHSDVGAATEDSIPVATAGLGAAVGASVDALHDSHRLRLVYRRR